MALVGAAIGYVLGGVFLNIYTDFHLVDTVDIDPSHPLWVGAWWLGFICIWLAAWIIAFFIHLYPPTLPGAEKHLEVGNDMSNYLRKVFKSLSLQKIKYHFN